MANLKRLSKFLSLILRHRAADFGIELDAQGYADLESVWAVVEARNPGQYTQADLQPILAGELDGKQRFEIADGRIRALYGHSKVRPIEYPPVEPPDALYHGTTPQALAAIRKHGLKSMRRQYVHLSTTIERAVTVAARRGEPVILTIRAKEAHDAGLIFYHPEPEHYLVEAVPPEFVVFPENGSR